MNGQTVTCSHILLKHNQSRNPLDRVRNKTITRTKEEAILGIQKIHQMLVQEKCSNFLQLAKEHSECSSQLQGGDLGEFGKGQMQEAFESVAFGLNIGELSNLVDTDSGIHVILRTK